MAAALTIARSTALMVALEKITGVTPSVEYYGDYARIYWDADNLLLMQHKLDEWSRPSDQQSDIKVDWLPVVTPAVIKKALPVAIGIFVLGYFLGSR